MTTPDDKQPCYQDPVDDTDYFAEVTEGIPVAEPAPPPPWEDMVAILERARSDAIALSKNGVVMTENGLVTSDVHISVVRNLEAERDRAIARANRKASEIGEDIINRSGLKKDLAYAHARIRQLEADLKAAHDFSVTGVRFRTVYQGPTPWYKRLALWLREW